MKKLLILPLLVLLTGCVTYYYPETALEDGVYYAEDDPSYTVYSGGYAGVSYYPWSSLDYFYTGYYPYPGLGVGYGYNSRFSVGFSYGYSPWYYPYNNYGYYSPWYASHHYPAWRPYRGYCSHHHGCGHKKKKKRHDNGHDWYAGNDKKDRRDRSSRNADNDRYKNDRRSRDDGSIRNRSVRRYVSTAPSGHSSNRGMVIRSNGSTKIGKSRVHKDKTVPVRTVKATPSASRSVQPRYSTRRTSNEIRYRSDAKQSRSKTGPVNLTPSSRELEVVATPRVNRRASVNPGNGRDYSARAPSGRKGASLNSPSPAKPKVSSENSKRSSPVSSSRGKKASKKKRSSHRENRK